MTEPTLDPEDHEDPAPYVPIDDEWVWWNVYDFAGRTLLGAVDDLVSYWEEEDDEVAPSQVESVLRSKRGSPEQKSDILRLLALATFERALTFHIALRIAVNLDQGTSWYGMAKALGVSRQGLHRKYHSLVEEIRSPTAGEELADLASRFGSLPQPE